MNQIDLNQLPLIIGGFATSGWYAPVNNIMTATTAKPVTSFKPTGIPNFTNNMQDLESCQNYCPVFCKVEKPKNGDLNSFGQIYSWGTWWDDTH